jgi:hypothetical protein
LWLRQNYISKTRRGEKGVTLRKIIGKKKILLRLREVSECLEDESPILYSVEGI